MNNKLVAIGIMLVLLIVGFSGCTEQKENKNNDDVSSDTIGKNILLNSGFEEGNNSAPSPWFTADVPADNLTMVWVDAIFYEGSRSVGILNYHNYTNATCNNWAQTITEIPYNKTLVLSGWIKTLDSEDVGMVIQCLDEAYNFVGFGSTETFNPLNGTNDWGLYNASVFVPLETEMIVVRLFLCGTGEAWFDDVQLTVK